MHSVPSRSVNFWYCRGYPMHSISFRETGTGIPYFTEQNAWGSPFNAKNYVCPAHAWLLAYCRLNVLHQDSCKMSTVYIVHLTPLPISTIVKLLQNPAQVSISTLPPVKLKAGDVFIYSDSGDEHKKGMWSKHYNNNY